jgi:peptidoglycan/xylan/chitin deacetylase (PgdA/CDA1 family)
VHPGSVAFTMDDGFWDQAEIGAEIFLAEDCPVTIFVITDFLDGKLWPWDDRLAWVFEHTRQTRLDGAHLGIHTPLQLASQMDRAVALRKVRAHCKQLPREPVESILSQLSTLLEVEVPVSPPRRHRPMTWDAVRSLAARGVDFGPHSRSHYILSRLGDEAARAEIQGSWSRLRAELPAPAPVFAWPTGRAADFSERDIQLVKSLGLIGAVATDDNYASAGDAEQMYRLRRFAMPASIEDAVQYASWVERFKQLARGERSAR